MYPQDSRTAQSILALCVEKNTGFNHTWFAEYIIVPSAHRRPVDMFSERLSRFMTPLDVFTKGPQRFIRGRLFLE
jgi:hypothetical protein